MDRIQIEREVRNCIAKGEWERAISLYRELLEKRGNDPNIYNLIGDVYAKMGDVADALPEYMRSIELYANEGLYENGIAVCKKILRISPDSKEIYFYLASFYAEIGLLNEALDALTKYTEEAKNKKEIEKRPQDYQKLITIIASDIRLKPKVKEIYINLNQKISELDVILGISTIEKKKEEPEKEIITFDEEFLSHKEEKIGTAEPRISPYIANRIKEGQPKIGEKGRIFTKPPIYTEIKREEHKIVPEIEKKAEIKDKDVEFLLHAIEEIKASSQKEILKDHYKLGIEYKNFGFYDAAIKEFQLCVATGIQKLKALRELGYCFLEKGEPKLAINVFNRALEEGGSSGSDSLSLLYGLGLSYELLNEKDKAIKAFEQVYVRNVDYKDVQEKLRKLR